MIGEEVGLARIKIVDLPSYNELFLRNIGIVTQDEQEKLKQSTIAIAGVGGDGGLIAETLARAGIGHIRIADPGEFEANNTNRQNGCYIDTLDMNKARVIEDIIKRINPFCHVEVFDEGINKKNVHAFVAGADILIDESEFTHHEVAIMLARAARNLSIPLITGLNIGFGSFVFAFTPESISFDKYLGFSESEMIENISAAEVPVSKWCPRLPNYIDIRVLKDVASGKTAVPGISPSVASVAAVVSTEVLMYILNRKSLVEAPKYIWVDHYNRKMKIRRANIVSFYISLIIMGLNSRKKRRT